MVGDAQDGRDLGPLARGAGRSRFAGAARDGGNAFPLAVVNILAGREANLKAREENPESEETLWLIAHVADLAVGNALLRENRHRLEASRPLGRQRGKR